MKKITLWLFALFTCWQISAQTGTIVVGVNDGTPNASWEDPSPLQDNYKTQRIQILYTASELSGAGLIAGPITEIGWVATALNTSTLQENYTISMMSTSSTVLTGTFVSGSTLVYGPADFTPSATGNVMFTLTTPFVWDGTSNVIIELCAGLASGAWTSNVSCANSTTSDVKTVYYRNDSATSPCTQATGTTTTTRPVLVAVGNVASCLAPLNLVSANINAFTADVSWDASTSGSAVGYEYVVSTSSTTPAGAGTAVTNSYASLSALLPQTTYYLFVRTHCGGGTFSGWNGPVSFTTSCAPITTFPSLEPFATFLPNQCWYQGNGGDLTAGPTTTGTSSWYVDGLGNVGNTGAVNYNLYLSGGNDWVISPQYTIPASGYELKLIAAITNYGSTTAPTNWDAGDTVEILVSTTGNTNWTPLYTYDVSNYSSVLPAGSLNVIDLDAYSGQTVRFAIRAFEGASGRDIDFSFDNFEVRVSPTCPDLTGVTMGVITSTTAGFSWDDLGTLGYQYAITTSATSPASGTAITTTFDSVSSLLPQTVYYLHVRAECAGSIFGNWSTVSFTTACAPIANFNENFDAVTTPNLPVCWSKIISGATVSAFASVNSVNFVSASAPNGVDLYNSSSAATDNIMLVTPILTNLSAATHRLKFKARNNSDTQDLEIGVLTDASDASTFTLVQAVDITTTFQSYVVNFDTFSGSGAAIAIRRLSTSTYTNVYLDDIVWEAMPACPDQTGLVVSNITSSGADTSWDDLSGSGVNGYEYAVTTSATPPASGTPTTDLFYIVTGLAPQTVHYLHVRTNCGAGNYGVWITIPFTTACAPISSLPWLENFDAVTVPALPQCWFEENGDYQTSNSTFSNTPHSGANYLRDSWFATNEFMWTPAFDLVAGTSYDFSSWIQGDGGTAWVVDYFVNSAQNSTGATQLGTAYNVPGTGTFTIQPYTKVTRSFVPATTGTYYFAIRVNQPGFPNYIAFDDFELKISPSIPPACATNVVATTNACGNFSNNLAWDLEPTATGYYITIGTTSGGTDIANAVNLGSNSYSFSGSINTQYFWTVVPYNAAGSAVGCTEQSFTTVATGCYCASVPSNLDNLGITTAVIGATSNSISPVTYTNLTAVPEIVAQGANTNVQLTFNTGYTYDINIWIDFNNDYDFDDVGELVKTGIACTTDQPNTVDASFIMPLSAPSGLHRMRIGTSDTGQVPPNACYNGFYGVTLDFTIDTTVLSSNSFDTTNFVAYPNPVKDVLNLSYKTAINNVRVINLLGQEVVNSNVDSNEVKVNMSGLTSGAYIVNVTVDDTVHTIKVIKE